MTAAQPLEDQGHGFEGRVLGGFRMSRELACGGMATVYLAHKAGTLGVGQPAAVKVIHPHLARDRDFVDMFLDEARIVSCIAHPNVCRVLDFGKAEGTYYLAMEFVMGETWADVLTRMKGTKEAQPVIPSLLAQVLSQACEGLHAAHEAQDPVGTPLQIVHRDISPQNLIIGYDGSVRVLDFGIASAADKLHTTRNGTVKGRFAYMAPEQMRGHAVDRRADIWSLGVVLWEGLAQRRMFKRETEAETVLAVTHDPLPSLEGAGHPVPAALARIAGQALRRSRDKRYATAREMGLELSRYASSSLVPMGMPEVSIWMQRLFADRIEQKRGIMREAANAANAQARSIPAPELRSEVQPLTLERTIASAPAAQSGVYAGPSISAVRAARRAKPSKLGAIGVALALTAAVAFALTSGDDARKQAADAKAVATAKQTAAMKREHQATAAKVTAEPAPPQTAEPVAASPTPSAARDTAARPVMRKAVVLGTISIATPGGWAEVYLGGKKLGTTPARYELPVGFHTLRLRPFGKLPELTRRVEIQKGTSAKLKIEIE